MVAWSAARVTAVFHEGLTYWVLGGVLGGYLLADFLSGVVHWGCDRYGSGDTPFLGPNFIVPFREHHVDPKGITRHDFIETNGNTCIVAMPFALSGHFIFDVESGVGWLLMGHLVLITLCAFTFGTNQFHKWAHLSPSERGPIVRFLQATKLVLGIKHHKVHHTVPFETYFCITSGLLNPMLHRMNFWAGSERLIYKVTGVKAGVDDRKVAGIDEPTDDDRDDDPNAYTGPLSVEGGLGE